MNFCSHPHCQSPEHSFVFCLKAKRLKDTKLTNHCGIVRAFAAHKNPFRAALWCDTALYPEKLFPLSLIVPPWSRDWPFPSAGGLPSGKISELVIINLIPFAQQVWWTGRLLSWGGYFQIPSFPSKTHPQINSPEHFSTGIWAEKASVPGMLRGQPEMHLHLHLLKISALAPTAPQQFLFLQCHSMNKLFHSKCTHSYNPGFASHASRVRKRKSWPHFCRNTHLNNWIEKIKTQEPWME